MLRFLLLLVTSTALLAQGIITTVAGTGVQGYGGDGGPAARASFFLGVGISELEVFSHPAFDAQGNLYIPDVVNNRIRKIDRDGNITTVAGNGIHGYSGEGVPASAAQLDWPHAVAFDAAGNLHIADTHNNRVRRVTAAGGTITTVAGNGDHDFYGNGGRALSAAFDRPAGLAFDAASNLYISDQYNNQVRKVSTAGIITAYAGNGDHAFFGEGVPATEASLDFPAGLAVDAAGNLYIADQHNHRVRKVSPSGTITTFAGNGVPGFSGDGAVAVNAALNFPADVAVDSTGNVYIADQRNNRVRRVRPDGVIQTVAGNGIQGYSGDGGPPLAAFLARPSGLAFDSQGSLFITDHYNNRIRKVVFNPPALALSASSLQFASTAGAPAPPAQTITLTNSGIGTVNFTVIADQPWLTVAPASGTAAAAAVTLSVRVDLASLAAGEYAGLITVRSPEAVNSPQTVRVALVVRPMAAPAPSFTAAAVVHAATFVSGPIAPGQLISIFGANLGPASEVLLALDPATGRIATTRGGVTVLFNDVPGSLFYVQQRQINVQAPYELAGQSTARIVVRYLESSSAPVSVPVAAAAPGIFAVAGGSGQAALLNQDFSVNSAANPAARGSVVQIFLTGAGSTTPTAATGELPRVPLPAPTLPVTVTIGGRTAAVTFAGLAPGLAGLLQVNATVPDEVTPAANVPLEVSVGAARSQPGITLAISAGN